MVCACVIAVCGDEVRRVTWRQGKEQLRTGAWAGCHGHVGHGAWAQAERGDDNGLEGREQWEVRLLTERLSASSRGRRRVVEGEDVVAAYEGAAVDVAGKILTVTVILGASGSDILCRGWRRRKGPIPKLSLASGALWRRGVDEVLRWFSFGEGNRE